MRVLRLAMLSLAASLASLPACGPCHQSRTKILSDSLDWDSFGAPIGSTVLPSGTLKQAVDDPESYSGSPVLLRDATIDSVCKKKGCWMVVSDGGAPVRVTFKDYGFFVPTDCEGRSAMIEGVFSVRMVPEAEARHYLEDAGRHDDAMKLAGDQKELTIVATGVRLSK